MPRKLLDSECSKLKNALEEKISQRVALDGKDGSEN
jgi:hypothetical protein